MCVSVGIGLLYCTTGRPAINVCQHGCLSGLSRCLLTKEMNVACYMSVCLRISLAFVVDLRPRQRWHLERSRDLPVSGD